MKIALLFNKYYLHTWGIYVEKALRRTGHHIIHFQSHDLHTIKDKYDLYFKVDDGDYTYDFPAHLRPRVYYVSDLHLKPAYEQIKKQAGHYDIVFCAFLEGTKKLKAHGIKTYWVNAACDLDVHGKLDLPKKYAIGFVGTSGGIPRQFYLQALRERYPHSYIYHAPYTKMSEIYSQSKIGFSYPIRENCFTMRSFEILASGTFLLMKNFKNKNDNSIQIMGFKNNTHLKLFDSTDELFKIIDYYLLHDREREEIALQGYNFVKEYHTYDHRIKEILEIIKQDLDIY